jgi:peptidoglycan/xylan/chitin deacetylase (PgdA/CDA1 family)
MFYFVKTPGFLKKIYASCIWNMPVDQKKIYLTFDDGPHPTATPFVLDELKKYNAKATFFCIGKNVETHPQLYKRILNEGHRTGNHTQNHLNGWKASDENYFDDIKDAAKVIDSNLFRPPYGRISQFQIAALIKQNIKIIMWDVLSGDFDEKISAETCTSNVIKHAANGSIIVFHDSEKALEKMKVSLRETLNYFSRFGYSFEVIY